MGMPDLHWPRTSCRNQINELWLIIPSKSVAPDVSPVACPKATLFAVSTSFCYSPTPLFKAFPIGDSGMLYINDRVLYIDSKLLFWQWQSNHMFDCFTFDSHAHSKRTTRCQTVRSHCRTAASHAALVLSSCISLISFGLSRRRVCCGILF